MQEPDVGKPPRASTSANLRLAATLVLAAVLLVVLYLAFAVYVPGAQRAALQPNITLTEPPPSVGLHCYSSGCWLWITGTLTNAGNADGFATVNWVLNDNVTQQVRYLVPAGDSYKILLTQEWPAGNSMLPQFDILELISVQKA